MATAKRKGSAEMIHPVKGRVQDYCHVHNTSPAASLCQKCSKLICIKCTIREHNPHEKLTLEEAIDSTAEKIKTSLRSLEDSISKQDAELQKSTRDLAIFPKRAKDQQAVLVRRKEGLEATLDGEYKIQLKKLNEDYQRQKSALKKEFAGKERELAETCKKLKKTEEDAVDEMKRHLQELEDTAKDCRGISATSSLSKMMCVVEKAAKAPTRSKARNRLQKQIEAPFLSFRPALDVEVATKKEEPKTSICSYGSTQGAAGGVGGVGESERCAFCDEEAFTQALKCPHLLCTDCFGYTNKYKRCPACVHHRAQARQANKLDVTGRGKTPRSPAKAGSKAGKDAAKARLDEKQKEEEEEEPECSICLSSGADVVDLQKLDKCKHTFCKLCIENWLKKKPVCPVCKTQYGQVTGNMPNGTMRVITHSHKSCPGYEGSGAIERNKSVLQFDLLNKTTTCGSYDFQVLLVLTPSAKQN